jgi:hypothetical protein
MDISSKLRLYTKSQMTLISLKFFIPVFFAAKRFILPHRKGFFLTNFISLPVYYLQPGELKRVEAFSVTRFLTELPGLSPFKPVAVSIGNSGNLTTEYVIKQMICGKRGFPGFFLGPPGRENTTRILKH